MKKSKQKGALMLGIVLLGLLGGGGGVVYASNAAIPGDFLYPIDRAGENMQMALTRNPADKAELELKFLDERIDELEEVLKKNGNSDKSKKNIEKAIDGVDKAYGRTEEMIQAHVEGTVSDVVHERVLEMQEENTAKHEIKLQEIKDKVVEKTEEKGKSEVKGKFEKTIEKSKRGNNRAKEGLGKNKEKPSKGEEE